jgi:hypothetical protein
MVGGLPGWSCALNDNNNDIVFVIADGGRQWEGEGRCPRWSVMVSEERWWDGGYTCLCTPNDNVVVVMVVLAGLCYDTRTIVAR